MMPLPRHATEITLLVGLLGLAKDYLVSHHQHTSKLKARKYQQHLAVKRLKEITRFKHIYLNGRLQERGMILEKLFNQMTPNHPNSPTHVRLMVEAVLALSNSALLSDALIHEPNHHTPSIECDWELVED